MSINGLAEDSCNPFQPLLGGRTTTRVPIGALAAAGAVLGVASIALGLITGATPLVLLGAALTTLGILLGGTEVILGTFVVVGGIKGAPYLSGSPVDLTLLTWAATVAAIVFRLASPGVRIPRFPSTVAIAGPLVALVLLSDTWAVDPSAGLGKALRFEFLTMTAFLAPLFLVRSRPSLVRLCGVFVASGLLIALTTVRTTNNGEPLAAAGGNEIQAALYPALGAVVILAYFLRVRTGRSRLAMCIPLAILVPATVAAGSRGVLVGASLAVAYVLGRSFMASRRKVTVGIAAIVCAAAVVVLGSRLAGSATSKYEQTLLTTNVSKILGGRSDLLSRGITIAAAHPTLGVGVGGYASARFVYEPQLYPHNIFVELSAEEGMPAAALLGFLILGAWWARGKAAGGVRGPEAVLAGSLILLALAEAMVSFDINGNKLLWFALGLAFALPTIDAPPPTGVPPGDKGRSRNA